MLSFFATYTLLGNLKTKKVFFFVSKTGCQLVPPWPEISFEFICQIEPDKQTSKKVRRSSVAKSSMVAMCCLTRTWWQCVASQEGGQSLGNPADTRRGKKRLTRMLIGNKNHGKYLTPILFKFCRHPIHTCLSLIQRPRLKSTRKTFSLLPLKISKPNWG